VKPIGRDTRSPRRQSRKRAWGGAAERAGRTGWRRQTHAEPKTLTRPARNPPFRLRCVPAWRQPLTPDAAECSETDVFAAGLRTIPLGVGSFVSHGPTRTTIGKRSVSPPLVMLAVRTHAPSLGGVQSAPASYHGEIAPPQESDSDGVPGVAVCTS
jgi:hypothetical protein